MRRRARRGAAHSRPAAPPATWAGAAARQVSQLLKRTCDVVVDQHGTGEPLAAVDDPVRDRLDAAEAVAQRRIELIRVHLCVGSVELTLGQDPVVIGDQVELQRA